MANGDIDRLRNLVGEPVPEEGSDDDTMFSDKELDDYLTAAGSLDAAALKVWEAKAANFANLVDVAEGNSSRAMSDLHKNALGMVKYFSDKIGAGSDDPGLQGRRGRASVGQIRRRGINEVRR